MEFLFDEMEPHPPPTFNVDWRDLIGRQLDLLVSRSDDIFSSPAKLGDLLSICVIFAELEPIVRERATTLALQKKEIPGWTLVHRDGNRYVEASHVRDLLLQCPANQLPALLEAVTKTLGSISESRWRMLCQAIGRQDAEESIAQTDATVFLRRNQNPNKES